MTNPLSDYKGQHLIWAQPASRDMFSLDLVKGDEVLATYRTVRTLKQVSTVESGPHRITFEAFGLLRWWHATSDDTTLTVFKRIHKRKHTFTIGEGPAYTYEADGLQGVNRTFTVAGGKEVLRLEAKARAKRIRGLVTLGPADIPQRDLVMIAGWAAHYLVLFRQQ